MGYIYKQQLRKNLKTSINSLSNLARKNAQSTLEARRQKIIDNFLNNEITQEIADGYDSESSIMPTGNLFSLLGFYKNSHPIKDFIKFLRTSIKLKNTPPLIVNDGDLLVKYIFTVDIPSEKDIKEVTPLTWDKSRSWMEEIEDGISSFSFYIFKRYFNSPPSRSSTGLQVKNVVRQEDFMPRLYLTKILDDLTQEFNAYD